MPRRWVGFTLAETLVVLVIIGLLLAVVPPMLSKGIPSLQLKSAVRDMVSGLRLARGEAVRRSESATFEIDLEAMELRVPTAGKTRRLPKEITIAATTAVDDQSDDQISIFRFFPDGSATGGNILMSSRERGFRITVDWLTGRIDVADES